MCSATRFSIWEAPGAGKLEAPGQAGLKALACGGIGWLAACGWHWWLGLHWKSVWEARAAALMAGRVGEDRGEDQGGGGGGLADATRVAWMPICQDRHGLSTPTDALPGGPWQRLRGLTTHAMSPPESAAPHVMMRPPSFTTLA